MMRMISQKLSGLSASEALNVLAVVTCEFYLQLTDSHFAQALSPQAAQNPAQYTAELVGTEQEPVGVGTRSRTELPSDSGQYVSVPEGDYPRQDSNL